MGKPIVVKVILDDEDELEKVKAELLKLSTIVVNLRIRSKVWKEHYGATNRIRMQEWEERADKWIDEHIEIKE